MSDTLKAGIYTALSGEATITALVSNNIYPDGAPEDVSLPYITYEATSEIGTHHMTGVTTLATTDIQFDVWAATSESRTDIKNALREFLDGVIRTTYGSTFIARAENTSNIDSNENPINGSQIIKFGVFMDFEFWHRR